MKFNKWFLGLAVLGLVFASCEDDETAKPPTISFDGSADYIAVDSEVNTNAVFVVKVTAIPNAESASKLVSFKVTKTFNNEPTTVVDEELDNLTSFEAEVSFEGRPTTGTERIVFEVVDKDGEVAEKVLNITYVDAPNPLNEFTAVLMGGQSNATTGSYLDADLGNVYLKAAAETNSALIDMIYYFGGSNNATLVAPDDATVNGGTGNLTMATGFSTKNSTRFNTNPGITASAFDEMTDDSSIDDISATSTIANQLAVDDVIVFETVTGKKGAIKVSAINGEAAGSITITVKIQ